MPKPAPRMEPGAKRFRQAAERKRRRKMRAAKQKEHSLWFGLGTFGIVGWSVAIPTVIGIVVGLWLDAQQGHSGTSVSWTLTFMIIGVTLGCLNAWFWVRREREQIHRDDSPATGQGPPPSEGGGEAERIQNRQESR